MFTGQVVAAQLQHRRAEQHAGGRGEQRRGGNHDPDRRVQAGREHGLEALEVFTQVRAGQERVHVGADGIEGDEAEVEQAGITDDDVQAQGQQHVQQRERHDAHGALTELLREQRQGDQHGRGNQEEEKLFLLGHARSLLMLCRPHAHRADPRAAA
jgi:hypothetical protein